MIGVIYRRMDSLKPAIDNHQNALQIIEKINPKTEYVLRNKAVSLNCLGNIYVSLNQLDIALETFKKSIAIEEKLKNYLGIAINYQNIGGVYENQNKLDLALENYRKSLEFNKKIDSKIGFMICNNSIGVVLIKQNKPKEAFESIEPTIPFAEKSGDAFYIASSYINLGWAYLKLNDLGKAKMRINKGLQIAEEKKLTFYIANAYQLLSEIAEKEKKYDLATYYLKTYYKNKEKIASENKIKSLFSFISKYESEKKENLIKLQNKQLKINKLALKYHEKQQLAYALGLGFMAIIGGLLFYQSYNRKKTNQKLQVLNTDLDQANKTKTRFFNILNHDLRAPVSNLIGFLHLQKENPEMLDEENKTRLQNKTIAGAENLLNSMEDILLWSKGQMENFEPKFKTFAVNALFEDTSNHFSGEEKVKIIFEDPKNLQITTDENYLKTIIRNLTGNAIKAVSEIQNPTIIWKAWQEHNKNYLSITDNGLGASNQDFKALYDETQVVGIKTGLGLHLIRDLAKAINCEITVDSKVGIGTTFTLQLS
jgi:signal transduction histidine kinase